MFPAILCLEFFQFSYNRDQLLLKNRATLFIKRFEFDSSEVIVFLNISVKSSVQFPKFCFYASKVLLKKRENRKRRFFKYYCLTNQEKQLSGIR